MGDSDNGELDLELQEVIGELIARVDTVETIIKNMEVGPLYQEDFAVIYREYHTLKSEAAILELPDFSEFAKKVESSLVPYREEVIFLEDKTIEAFKKVVLLSREFLSHAGKAVPDDLIKASGNAADILVALFSGKEPPAEIPFAPSSSTETAPPEAAAGEGDDLGFFALDEEEEAAAKEPVEEKAPEEPSFFALDEEEEAAAKEVAEKEEEEEPSFFALDDEEEAQLKEKEEAPAAEEEEEPGFFALDEDEEQAVAEEEKDGSTSPATIAEFIPFIKKAKEKELLASHYKDISVLLEQYEDDFTKCKKKEVEELYTLHRIFITKGTEHDYTNFGVFSENLLLLLETIENVIAKLREKKTVNIKSSLSKLKLYLGLFDYIPEEGHEIAAEDDSSEWVDEIMKRIENVEQIVLAMEEGPIVHDDINTIFREFHTMKSESALLELMAISEFSHKVESALSPLREMDYNVTAEVIETFMEIIDNGKFLISLGKKEPTEGEKQQVYNPVTQLVDLIARKEVETHEEKEEAGATEEQPSEEDRASSSVESSFKKELAELAESKSRANSIEVKIDRLDKLINLAGEITTIFHLINQSETIRGLNNQSLLNDLNLLGRMCKDLQASSMTMRMISIMPLFHKLNRVVRNIAKGERKKVVVELVGTDLEVDKNVVDTVSEALVHMMRNSVDHGIEPPRERIDNGKKETATIKLIISKKEDQVIFRIRDDGRGIDEAKVREAIISKGLLEKDAAEKLSKKEVYSYLFKPGFSTAKKITAVSGRGVGMDVVMNSVNELGGVVEVDSEPGHWTEVTISIPSSYTQIETLLVRVGENFFMLPVTMVKEMLDYGSAEVNSINQKSNVIKVRGELLPLIALDELMNCTYDENSQRAIVVVEYRRRKCSLLFDEVLTTQEVVLKKLEGPVSKLEYISGSGILGNRKIGLLLNIQKVLDKVSKEFKDLAAGDEFEAEDRDRDRIETVSIGTNKVAMIDFYIEWQKENGGKERALFAMNAFKTLEFVTKKHIIPVPNSPAAFEGVMQIRESTLPVLNLAKMIGLDYLGVKNDLIIVCEFNRKRVGISVTGVNKVNYVSWDSILPPPKTNNLVKSQYVVGNILDGEKIIMVLDFERLLGEVMHFYDELHIADEEEGIEAIDKRVRLMVVEDSHLVRKRFSKSLRDANYEVFEAENGREALDMLNKMYEEARLTNHTILDYLDAVITDIEMPLMDGYSLTKSIKEHPEIRVLPVVLHSSITNETMVRRSKEVHADGFINKCDTKGLKEFLQNNL